MKRVQMRRIRTAVMCIAAGLLCAGNAYAAEDLRGTCYEIFVGSFYDSDGDGTGDLRGVTEKLDYINDGNPDTWEDLGCDMIWLMPVFPSPTYHKYDAADYCSIDPQYASSFDDFDALVLAAHQRGIRVILDLPLNHTSTEHPWFVQAADWLREHDRDGEQDPSDAADQISYPDPSDCPYVSYYNFSRENQTGYAPLDGTGWYYEARFWSGMPDLNLDNEAVRDEIRQITDFWLDRGADGFRLDAVTSYYTDSKADSIAFLAWLNETVKEQSPDAYLVGEAWTDPDTYASYYASGIDSMFDFAFAGQEGYIAALARGKRDASWYGTKLMAEEALFAGYGDHVINAPFYTNHDMARSAGYYTRDDGSRTKLAQALNLLMPGNAFLYYGEELGMKGSGKDENKRAPMYWTDDPDAGGMCSGPPEMDEVKMKYPPHDVQAEDPGSIFSYVRKAVHLRSAYPMIARGKTVMVEELSGKSVCVLIRDTDGAAEETTETEPVMIVINMDDEDVSVDLSGSEQSRDYSSLADTLCVSSEEPVLENGKLSLPAFGIAILQKETAG